MKTNIVIEVRGGLVQNVFTNDPNVQVTVVDYDNDDNPNLLLMCEEEETTAQDVIESGWAVF